MQNDLISRSALLNEYRDFKDMDCPSGHTVTADYMIELVEDAPAVDAVEVVRCKDCLNAMKIAESDRERWPVREDALQCGLIGHVVLPDDYCSGGCKMDAEANDV